MQLVEESKLGEEADKSFLATKGGGVGVKESVIIMALSNVQISKSNQ